MADDARSRRLTALEEKKRRLEELKARRSTRTVDGPSAGGGRAASASVGTGTEATGGGGGLDDYIDGLLASKAPAVAPVTEDEAEGDGGGEEEEKGGAPSDDSAVSGEAAAKTTAAVGEGGATTPSQQQQQQQQQHAKKRVETFSIATQTEEDDFPPPSQASSVSEDEEEKAEHADEAEGVEGRAAEGGKGGEDGPVAPPLTREERDAAISSAPFSSFFTTASKRVERLLGAPLLSDLLADANYAGEEDGGGGDAAGAPGARGGLLAGGGGAGAVFECPRWTAGRTVTDVNWSPAHRELLLGSYHAPSSCSPTSPSSSSTPAGPDASTSAEAATATMMTKQTAAANSALISPQRAGEERCDGLAVVWNLAMPNRPEHIFSSNSPVLAARFHPTEHHLVVGGCHSGQVVVWDLRSGRLPVQKSTLAIVGGGGAGGGAEKGGGAGVPPKGHAHPICALEVAEGGSGLVTASTDGRLNFWSLGNLRDPAESFFLRGANLSSLAVAPESDSVICGDEAGGLHAVVPQSSSAPTAGGGGGGGPARRTVRTFDASAADGDGGGDGNGGGGHFGMVTAVATKHPAIHASANAPSLSLSRGFVRGATGLVLTSGVDWTTKLWAPAYVDRPLLSFTSSSYDYMCDVQWSPTNPSLFASASSNGTVDIWNLASSLDEPLSGSDGISLASAGAGAAASDAASSPSPTNAAPSMPALNRLRWSGDGRRLAVASADRIHVLGVTEEVYRPKGDEEARMMGHLGARGLLDADA